MVNNLIIFIFFDILIFVANASRTQKIIGRHTIQMKNTNILASNFGTHI